MNVTGAKMTEQQRDRSPSSKPSFNQLYDDLASAWASHQKLRSVHAHIAELALSSENLDMKRAAMWDWWKENRLEVR
jgi:hypothetical protein